MFPICFIIVLMRWLPSLSSPLFTQGWASVFKSYDVTVVTASRDVCSVWQVCDVLASVFEIGNLTGAGVALEKRSEVIVSASMPAPRWVGEHHLETAEFRTLVTRGEGLGIAYRGMHCGRGCRGGWSEGVIHGIIQVTFLKYPVQEGGCLICSTSTITFLLPGHNCLCDRTFPGAHTHAWPCLGSSLRCDDLRGDQPVPHTSPD